MNILDKCREIKEEEKSTIEKVEMFLTPLKNRYVSKTISKNIKTVKKKFLGIFPYTKEIKEEEVKYTPLTIDIEKTINNTTVVRITHLNDPFSFIGTVMEFPDSLFSNSDEFILSDEKMIKFIKHFLFRAIPKWKKYEEWVNHIESEETKFYVADKLEELFDSDQFEKLRTNMKGPDGTEFVFNYVVNYVKVLEREYEKTI